MQACKRNKKNIQIILTLKNDVCHNREFQGTRENFWSGIAAEENDKGGINNYRMPITGQIPLKDFVYSLFSSHLILSIASQYLHLTLSPKLYKSQTVLIKSKMSDPVTPCLKTFQWFLISFLAGTDLFQLPSFHSETAD